MVGSFPAHRHTTLTIHTVIDELVQGLRNLLQRLIVHWHLSHHRCGNREDNAVGCKAALHQDVVDEKAMDAAVAIVERVNEHEAEGN